MTAFNPKTRETLDLSSIPSTQNFKNGLRESIHHHFKDVLPFTADDTTAGVENELQAVVLGNREQVDIPLNIKASNYYKNIVAEAKTGNSPKQAISALETFLDNNQNKVWENSWVRFPRSQLSIYANEIFERDLLADKRDIFGPQRPDKDQFTILVEGEEFVRTPISYLLKLSLADVLSNPTVHPKVVSIGREAMAHFLSDNTSPETFSFSPIPVNSKSSLGKGIVDETLIRYALCQFLVQYANTQFKISEHGQTALVYFAPNPPARQKQLNELISDSFYRELFMSPCLSGWDRGEEKKQYMALCHRVLSMSQLNALLKLKEVGILNRNLVVLPNTSNISLANNGTHISFGSRKLSKLLSDPDSGFNEKHEKYIGDLVIKIVEHFLPIFVGTYSAAPYRLDFWDFHPEKVLGFLPHELESTHLKMIWRRWKKKANLRFFGQPLTPFGPMWLDRSLSRLFKLKGDFVPDFRLIDYFVSLLSTEQSPALNGQLGNDIRLKDDLSSMGIFDSSMSAYLLCKLRPYSHLGFSGFEGRHYSVFKDMSLDMTHAVNLQLLIICLAYQYVIQGKVSHNQIPDNPFIESERRQVFFSSAIGLPTFFVRKNSRNQFLQDVLSDTHMTRESRRYNGFIRVQVQHYLSALVRKLKKDGEGVIQDMGFKDTIKDLEARLSCPEKYSTSGKLTSAILQTTGTKSAMKLKANEFNSTAEKYYREGLRKENMKEAMEVLESYVGELDSMQSWRRGEYNTSLMNILQGKDARDFVTKAKKDLSWNRLSQPNLIRLVQLTLLVIDKNKKNSVHQ